MFFNDFGVPGTPKSDPKTLKSGFLGLLGALMDSWAALGALFGPTWVLFGRLGAFSAALGPSWAPSWGVFGRSWAVLGAPARAHLIWYRPGVALSHPPPRPFTVFKKNLNTVKSKSGRFSEFY